MPALLTNSPPARTSSRSCQGWRQCHLLPGEVTEFLLLFRVFSVSAVKVNHSVMNSSLLHTVGRLLGKEGAHPVASFPQEETQALPEPLPRAVEADPPPGLQALASRPGRPFLPATPRPELLVVLVPPSLELLAC